MNKPTHVIDASGFRVFAAGDFGHLHVQAHQLLDRGDFEGGYRALSSLARQPRPEVSSMVSDWTHLHWHQLVFELETGRFDDAFARFFDVVYPSAVRSDDAKTDAPSALWLLALHAPAPVALPWDEIAAICRRRRRPPTSAFVTIHDFLAFAGARSASDMDAWLRTATASPELRALVPFARSLRDSVLLNRGDDPAKLANEALRLRLAGGSAGQNRLFPLFAQNSNRLEHALAA